MQVAMSVQNLYAGYAERYILKGVSFDIPKGQTTAIVGSSGCGKSTLLKHLLGLLKPASGSIIFKDKDIAQADEDGLTEFRKSIGILFQGSALLNSMTIADNVALPLKEHTNLNESTIKIIVKMKLDLVGLTGFDKFYPSQLSGGMKKRAGIARAMALDPEMLFFDEPQAGLDPITSAGLDILICKLRDIFKITTVVVTHELHSLFTIANHVVMLDKGEVVFSGSIDEFKACEDIRVIRFLTRQPEVQSFSPDDYFKTITAD